MATQILQANADGTVEWSIKGGGTANTKLDDDCTGEETGTGGCLGTDWNDACASDQIYASYVGSPVDAVIGFDDVPGDGEWDYISEIELHAFLRQTHSGNATKVQISMSDVNEDQQQTIASGVLSSQWVTPVSWTPSGDDWARATVNAMTITFEGSGSSGTVCLASAYIVATSGNAPSGSERRIITISHFAPLLFFAAAGKKNKGLKRREFFDIKKWI